MNELLWLYHCCENWECQKIFSSTLLVLGVMLHSIISTFAECSVHIWEYLGIHEKGIFKHVSHYVVMEQMEPSCLFLLLMYITN